MPDYMQPCGLYSPLGSSVQGIFQARILEWVAVSFSRGSSGPRDRTHVSYVSCTSRHVLYHWCHLGRVNASLIFLPQLPHLTHLRSGPGLSSIFSCFFQFINSLFLVSTEILILFFHEFTLKKNYSWFLYSIFFSHGFPCFIYLEILAHSFYVVYLEITKSEVLGSLILLFIASLDSPF